MAYEHTVVNQFTMPGGRSYSIGDKITDEAEAEAIHAKHLGRNLSRHDVTTPDKPEKTAEPNPAPKPAAPAPRPASVSTAAAPPVPAVPAAS